MTRVVFDLDGTLIDSAEDIRGIANGLLAERGIDPINSRQARSFVGSGAAVFVQRLRAARDIPDSAQEALLAEFIARYDNAVDLTQPYPGVVPALEALAGMQMGICTNKPERPARAVLAHLGLSRHFGVVLGGDSLAVRKPEPAPLGTAFAALGEGPRVYVGDSEIDAETAARAGVSFLLYTEGYRKTPVSELPHDAAFDHFDALPGLVAAFAR